MRLGRRPSVCVCLVLVALGSAPSARADGKGPVLPAQGRPEAATAAARAAHERGLDARARGDWPLAYSELLVAWQHKHHWEIAVALGEAEMELGKYEDARDHLLFARRDPGFLERSEELVAAEEAQIAGWLAEAARQIDARQRAARAFVPLGRWAWIGAAGGGLFTATVVSGGVLTALAGEKVGEVGAALRELPGATGDPASVRCPGLAAATCRANEERLRAADDMQSAATALFVAASLVAVTTTILAIVWRDPPAGVPSVTPVIGAGSAGVTLSASW